MYDLLLKGGEVVDPAQGIHGNRDVAITDGRIVALEPEIALTSARKVIPLKGKLVTPGLIDLHCHAARGMLSWNAVDPDEVGLNSGVTLICEGGTSGAANFDTLRYSTISSVQTDMYAFLHIAPMGQLKQPEIWSEHDLDLDRTRRVIEQNRDDIKGIKVRVLESFSETLGLKVVETAKELASELKLPVMMHIGEVRDRVSHDKMDDFSRAAVTLLDKGDILIHFMTWRPGGLILPDGEIYPEIWEARKRGVILDSCHGRYNFSFKIARHAIDQGLLPDVISTDLNLIAVPAVQSLLVTMSKFLNLGLTLDQVVMMTTINPARALGEEKKRGSLTRGMPADVSILQLTEGDYLFSDGKAGGTLTGRYLLEPWMVLKRGVEFPCYSRYQIPPIDTPSV